MRGLRLERPLDDAYPVLHEFRCTRGKLVGQQVCDPDESAALLAISEDLRRCAVVRVPERSLDDGVGESACRIINADEDLAGHRAVEECHDPSVVAVEAAADDEAGHQTFVQGAEVSQRRPDVVRAGINYGLFYDCCHLIISFVVFALSAGVVTAAARWHLATARPGDSLLRCRD